MCVKSQDECDPYDFNFLDKELIYMAQICGSRQKYIKMVLKRMRINESVSSSEFDESQSLSSSSYDNDGNVMPNRPSVSFSSHEVESTVEKNKSEKEGEEDGNDDDIDKESDEYLIEKDNLYIDCKIHMPR